MRPESIGDYEGTDDIRLGNIEGLNYQTLEFEKSPTIFIVRDNSSKTRNEYFPRLEMRVSLTSRNISTRGRMK